jgi:hypothetical protein
MVICTLVVQDFFTNQLLQYDLTSQLKGYVITCTRVATSRLLLLQSKSDKKEHDKLLRCIQQTQSQKPLT